MQLRKKYNSLKDKKSGIISKPFKHPKFIPSSKKLSEEEVKKEEYEHALKFQKQEKEYDEVKEIIKSVEESEVLKNSDNKESEDQVKERLISLGAEREKIKKSRHDEAKKLAKEERDFKTAVKNTLLGCNLALLVNIRQQEYLMTDDPDEKKKLKETLKHNYKIIGKNVQNTIELVNATISTSSNLDNKKSTKDPVPSNSNVDVTPDTSSTSVNVVHAKTNTPCMLTSQKTNVSTPTVTQLHMLSTMASQMLTESTELNDEEDTDDVEISDNNYEQDSDENL